MCKNIGGTQMLYLKNNAKKITFSQLNFEVSAALKINLRWHKAQKDSSTIKIAALRKIYTRKNEKRWNKKWKNSSSEKKVVIFVTFGILLQCKK